MTALGLQKRIEQEFQWNSENNNWDFKKLHDGPEKKNR